jgi:hypothetical protein
MTDPEPSNRRPIVRFLVTAVMTIGTGILVAGALLPFADDIKPPPEVGGRWGVAAIVFAVGAAITGGSKYLYRKLRL